MKNVLTTLLIVVLAFSVCTAGAGESNNKFYGKLHTSLNFVDDGAQTGITMTSNTSRFGFKGGIELNENFTAIYQVESKLDIAATGGTLAARNTFVGLKGDWGALLGGIHDTPFKTLGRKVTFFKDQVGDPRTMTMGYDQRVTHVAVYMAPKHDMFGGQLAYQFDQNDWQVADNPATPANEEELAATLFSGMIYATPDLGDSGDLFVGVAYESLSKGYKFTTEDARFKSSGAFRAAANYTAEQFAISALFQSISDWYTVMGADATTFGGEAKFMATEKWHIKANYYSTTLKSEGSTTDVTGSQFAVGVDHVFAPRTTFYLQMAMITNDDNSEFNLGKNTVGTGVTNLPDDISWNNGWGGDYTTATKTAGGFENPMAISLGVMHSF